ncbi:MAG: hypothetical protein PSX36_07450 [bacterium]|nr:hypothetical protein [bacterium]
MKKLLIVLCALAFISASFFTSCKKYEDGPAISLRTKKARLQGDWQLESFSINEVDQTAAATTQYGSNFTWDIEKDGGYKMTGTYTDDGTWKFGEDKDDVYFQSSKTGAGEQAYRILRLANKELWLKQVQANGDVKKWKLKQ